MPSTASPEDKAREAARTKAFREANELMGRAWHVGGNSAKEYTEEQLQEAIRLYGDAKRLWEALGNRTWEARTCHHAIEAIETTLAAKRASAALASATGGHR